MRLLIPIALLVAFALTYTSAQTIKLHSGSLSGSAVESGMLDLGVEPGDPISGTITVETRHGWDDANICPMAMVWSWGTHQTSYAEINHDVWSGTRTYQAPINLTAPGIEGTYYISFSFALEIGAQYVAALCSWRVGGAPIWNDGHDMADWSETEYNQSVVDHFVTTQFQVSSGWVEKDMPAAMVRITVAEPARVVTTSPAQNALNVDISSDIAVTFDMDMDSSSIDDTTLTAGGSISGPMVGSVTFDPGTRTAIFGPLSDFAVGEQVSVYLSNGIRSSMGVPLSHGFCLGYTTAVDPGLGAFSVDTTYTGITDPISVHLADLNSDGYPDLITPMHRPHKVQVMLNRGDGVFLPRSEYGTDEQPYGVNSADIDADGDLDVLVTCQTTNVINTLLNDGDGSLVKDSAYPTGGWVKDVVAADLDGDGDLDLATANGGTDDISILMNNGDGTFANQVVYASGETPYAIVAADLDNDGDMDLATADAYGWTLSVFLNDGHGTFPPRVSYPQIMNTRDVEAADLDGDGDVDLVTSRSSGSDAFTVFKNKGDGTFDPPLFYPAFDISWSLATGDFDGDGDIDVATGSYWEAYIETHLNDGNGAFTSNGLYAIGGAAQGICDADLNGDGLTDLAAACFDGNAISILLNQGTTGVREIPMSDLPVTYELAQNYPNPFNPTTTFAFSLPVESEVNLTIYNILGQTVANVLQDVLSVGQYEITWNGRDTDGHPAASGVYFARLRADGFSASRKIMLLK